MKKLSYILVLLFLSINMVGCNSKYKGYWCSYSDTATIVVLLNHNQTEKDRQAIEKKINEFDNVSSSNYYSRDDYASGLGSGELDIYDTYVISFSSMDYIGDYVNELSKMNGVMSAEQSFAKSNISLYHIKSWGKYSFTNSDEANEEDLETGKYKIKNGVITFTPEKNGEKSRILYTKDGLLCADTECNTIFGRSNNTCSTDQN